MHVLTTTTCFNAWFDWGGQGEDVKSINSILNY